MFVRRIATPRNVNQIQRNFVRFFADPRPSNPGGAGAAAAGSKYGYGSAGAPAQGSGKMDDPVGATSSFSGYGNNSFSEPSTASSGKDSGFSASSSSANNYSGSSGPASSSAEFSSGKSSSGSSSSGSSHSSGSSSGMGGGSGTMMRTSWSNYALIGGIIGAPIMYFYYTKNRRHGMAKETEQSANRSMPIESQLNVRVSNQVRRRVMTNTYD